MYVLLRCLPDLPRRAGHLFSASVCFALRSSSLCLPAHPLPLCSVLTNNLSPRTLPAPHPPPPPPSLPSACSHPRTRKHTREKATSASCLRLMACLVRLSSSNSTTVTAHRREREDALSPVRATERNRASRHTRAVQASTCRVTRSHFFAVAALLASETREREQKDYLFAFVIIDLPAPASPHRESVSWRLAVPEFCLVAGTTVPFLFFFSVLTHATSTVASVYFLLSFSALFRSAAWHSCVIEQLLRACLHSLRVYVCAGVGVGVCQLRR